MRKLSFVIIISLIIVFSSISVNGVNNFLEQSEDPYDVLDYKVKLLKQVYLTSEDFKEELANDAKLKDTHDYAKELGYVYTSSIVENHYSDGSIVLNVVLKDSEQLKYVLLTRLDKNFEKQSMIFKFDEGEVTFFDRDGGIRLNEDGVSGYSTHQSCSASLCTGACAVYYGWGSGELAGLLQGIVDSLSNACAGCGQSGAMCVPVCKAAIGMCTTVVACIPGVGACVGCIGITCGECIANAGLSAWDVLAKLNTCRKECFEDPSRYPNYPGWHCDPKKKESNWQCRGEVLQKLECDNCDWTVVYERDCASIGKECGYSYSRSMKKVEYQCIEGCDNDADCEDNNDCTTEYCALGKCQYITKSCPKPSDRCSISYCANGKGCVTKPDPGCDHPDDAYGAANLGGVVSSVILEEPADEEEELIKVAVLFEGFPESTKEMLESINQNFTFVNIDVKQEELNKYPLFIIPAGGLQGLSNSPTFKDKLKQYVEQGGNLFVFSQQHGYEYSVLPRTVEAYGWLEDQSCQWSSVYLQTYHPMLSSISKQKPDVNVDGYFTGWPYDATILLRRVKNGMPVLIKYNVSRGNVIAYTAYSDWVFGRGASKEEINFVRDIVTWAKDSSREIIEIDQNQAINFNLNLSKTPAAPLDAPRFNLGNKVSLDVNVTNENGTRASKIAFELYDPDYSVVYVNVSDTVSGKSNKIVKLEYQTDLDTSKGGWYVLFKLYDSSGNYLTGGYGGGFVLSDGDESETPYYIKYTLTNPGGEVKVNKTVAVNVSDNITSIDFNYSSTDKLGLWQLDYVVYANNKSDSGIVDYGGKFYSVSKYKQNPSAFYYKSADITFSVNSDSEDYFYGSTGLFEISITNNGDKPQEVTVWYSFPHNYWAKHDLIYGSPGTTSPGHRSNLYNTTVVGAGGTEIIQYSVPIYSYDRLWADLYYGDNTSRKYIGKASRGVYAVPAAFVISVETDKEEYLKGESITANIQMKNTLSKAQEGSMKIRLIDPKNNEIYSKIKNFNITSRGNNGAGTYNESIITSRLNLSGTYTLLVDGYNEKDASGQKTGGGNKFVKVPKDYLVNFKFKDSKNVYKAGDSLGYEIEVFNVGDNSFTADLTVLIPSLNNYNSGKLNVEDLASGSSKIFSLENIKVPDDILAGQHTGSIIVSLPKILEDSVKKIAFSVPNSKLNAYMVKKKYNASDYAVVYIENVGGVETNYEIRPNGWYFRDVASGKLGVIKPGEVKEVKFAIPVTFNGRYSLSFIYIDNGAGTSGSFYDNIDVQGISVEIEPAKSDYNVGEKLTLIARNPSIIDLNCSIKTYYSYYSDGVVKLIPANSEVLLELGAISGAIQTGSYGISLSCYEQYYGRSFTYNDKINITGLDLNISIDGSNYEAGDNYSLILKNTGPIDVECRSLYNTLSGNYYWNSNYLSDISIGFGEAKSYSFEVPKNFETGDYSVYASCYEKNSHRSFTKTFSISVLGFDTEIGLFENNVDAGEDLQIEFSNNGGLDANLNCDIYFDSVYWFSEKSVQILEGQSSVVSERIAKTKQYGVHGILVSCYDSISQTYFDLKENVTLTGFNVSLSSNIDEVDAYTNVSFTIENNGFKANLSCDYYLNLTKVGSGDFVVDKYEDQVANVLIPRDTDSGNYLLNINCNEIEAGKKSGLLKQIKVRGLELEFEVDKQSVVDGRDISITIFNKGGIDADCQVTTDLDGANKDENVYYVAKGNHVSYDYTISGSTGSYTLNIECIDKATGKNVNDSKKIEVSGFEFEVEVNSSNCVAGKEVEVSVTVGAKDANYKYTVLVGKGVYDALNDGNVAILSDDDYNYNISLDDDLESGTYKLIVGCEDNQTSKLSNVSVLLNITGLDLIMGADKENYVSGEDINVEMSNVGAIDAAGKLDVYLTKGVVVVKPDSYDGFNVLVGNNNDVDFNIPLDTDSGTYLLKTSFADVGTGRVINDSKEIIISGMELDIQTLGQDEGALVQPLVLGLKNIGALVLNLNCNVKLKDKDGIGFDLGSNNINLALNKTNESSYDLPDKLVSGRYSADVECSDTAIGKSVKKTFNLDILDFSADFGLKLAKDKFLTEENIVPYLEAEFDGKLNTMNNAKINLSVYSVTENDQAEEWNLYNKSDGLCGDWIMASAAYSNEVWFLAEDNDDYQVKLCNYDSDSKAWTDYDISSLGIWGWNMAVDSSYLWVASDNALFRYDKVNDVWDIFNSSNTDGAISENGQINSVQISGDEVWVLQQVWGQEFNSQDEVEMPQVNEQFGGLPIVFDGEWQAFDLSSIGLDVDTVQFLGFDGNLIWFGLQDGVASYDRATEELNKKYTSADSELLNEPLGSVAITDDHVWFTYLWNDGLVRFGKDSGDWELFTYENSEILSNGINTISAKDNNLWTSYFSEEQYQHTQIQEDFSGFGVSLFDESDDSWTHYNTENSGILSDQIGDILLGNNVYFMPQDINGFVELTEGTAVSYSLILSKLLVDDISEPGLDISNFSITNNGSYEARVKVNSESGQYVGDALAQFSVIQKNITANLTIDKVVYKPNGTIGITFKVSNNAEIEAENIGVSLYGDGIMFEQISVDVGAETSYIYETNHISDHSFLLSVKVDDNIDLQQNVKIESPVVVASAFAPLVGGSEEFLVGVVINNTGNVSADLNVIINDSVNVRSENVTVDLNSSLVVTDKISIEKDTNVSFLIVGDNNIDLGIKNIRFGEAVSFRLLESIFTSSGRVEIPFEFNNTGELDLRFNSTFVIDDQKVVKEVSLPFNKTMEDSVSFNLSDGGHELEYSSSLGTGKYIISVGSAEFEITNFVENVSYVLGANVSLNYTVKNVGGLFGSGIVKFSMPGVYEESKSIDLESGSETIVNFEFVLPDDLEERTYKIICDVNDSMVETELELEGVNVQVVPMLDKSLYSSGDTAVLNITVKNLNDLNLNLYTKVQYDEDFENVSFSLAAYEQKSLLTNIPVDDVNDGKIDYFVYMDSGRSLHIGSVYVNMEGSIDLYTDMQVYNIGEDVKITLNSSSVGSFELSFLNESYSDNLFSGTKTINYTIPELLSGVYYIDYSFKGVSGSYPIDILGYYSRIIDFDTDKDTYTALSTVTASINVESNKNLSGTMRLSIYDLDNNLVASKDYSVSLVDGENKLNGSIVLTSGMYGINKLTLEIFTDLSGEDNARLIHAAKYFDVADTNEPAIQHVLELLNLLGTDSYSVQFNLTQDNDGEYILEITGYDENGKPFSRIERFRVDSGIVEEAYIINETREFVANTSSFLNASEFGANIDITVNKDIKTSISIQRSDNVTNKSSFGIPQVGDYITIEAPEIVNDIVSARIVMYYDQAEIDALGLDESTLRLWYYNETSGSWIKYDEPNGGVDTVNNFVWAITDHFSVWSIFGNEKGGSGGGNNGGGGGGGGSGDSASNVEEVSDVVEIEPTGTVTVGCIPEWQCSSWGRCLNGNQARICRDFNNCKTDIGKPDESRECSQYLEPSQIDESEGNLVSDDGSNVFASITGAVIGLFDDKLAIGSFIVFVVVVGGLFLFSMFYGGMPYHDAATRAANFHRKGQQAFLKQNFKKSRKLYSKANKLRIKNNF